MVVLAVDGLSWSTAAATFRSAWLLCLASTFPSTSATAWMTAVTGTDVSRHWVVGMAYLVPERASVVNAITGQPMEWPGGRRRADRSPADGLLVRPQTTLFERAAAAGARACVLGRELDQVPGPWTDNLLRGATRLLVRPATGDGAYGRRLPIDPVAVIRSVVGDVDRHLAGHVGPPLLLWVYVNFDDHIHHHGYDVAVRRATARLERAASSWADQGWAVIAHSDHGQTLVEHDERLSAAWNRLDDPAYCRHPAGGAGRVRWLYPRPHLEARVEAILRAELGPHAVILHRDELADRGLLHMAPMLRERIGEVVAVAAGPRFPVPDPRCRFEHGATSDEEVLVPLARWDV